MRPILFVTLAAYLSACGSLASSGGSKAHAPASAEEIVGRWTLQSVTASGSNIEFSGREVIEFKADSSYVTFDENLAVKGKESCWSVTQGSYSVKDGKLTNTMTATDGSSGCTSDDFNPSVDTVSLNDNTLTMTTAKNVSLTFKKDSASDALVYPLLVEKMEKVELTVNDPDKAAAVTFMYRNPKQAGWKHLCPRLAGEGKSGFGTTPTFTYDGHIYDVSMQWDEGEINPDNYTGAAPGFEIEKRSNNSSDSVGYPGSGRYTCSNVADCASKCSLKISTYSLIDKTAKLVIECTNLPASSGTDSDNLFGASLSGFSLTLTCNYKPIF